MQADRQNGQRRTILKPKPNETRRTSCSGRGLHCVSCAICASSCPCTLEETGGTLISPGSPLNPRLRSSQNFHRKKTPSKVPFSLTGALRCTCRAPTCFHASDAARTPPRYRCPKNRAPQRELQTTKTTKTTEEGIGGGGSTGGERKRARGTGRAA